MLTLFTPAENHLEKHFFLVKYVFVIMRSMRFITTGLTQDLKYLSRVITSSPKYLSRVFRECKVYLFWPSNDSENVERRTHIPQTSNSTSVHTESTSVKGKHQPRILTSPRNGNFWPEKYRFHDHILWQQVCEGEGWISNLLADLALARSWR